ncbi:MAG TPA: hypothetical protein VGC96_07075 [Candidatus Elarobacter sp.]
MTKVFALVAMLAACVAPALQASAHGALAPADEYFGQLKMSVLGIRNELNTLERRCAGGDGNVAAMNGKLAMVDDAMRDWRAHYPRDTWLPRFQAQRDRVATMIASNGSAHFAAGSTAAAVTQILGTLQHRR